MYMMSSLKADGIQQQKTISGFIQESEAKVGTKQESVSPSTHRMFFSPLETVVSEDPSRSVVSENTNLLM